MTAQILKIPRGPSRCSADRWLRHAPARLPHIALADRGYTGPEYSTHAIINSEFVRVGRRGRRWRRPLRPARSWSPTSCPDLRTLHQERSRSNFLADLQEALRATSLRPTPSPPMASTPGSSSADSAKRALGDRREAGHAGISVWRMRDALTTTKELVGSAWHLHLPSPRPSHFGTRRALARHGEAREGAVEAAALGSIAPTAEASCGIRAAVQPLGAKVAARESCAVAPARFTNYPKLETLRCLGRPHDRGAIDRLPR